MPPQKKSPIHPTFCRRLHWTWYMNVSMLEATRREPNRIHRCLQQTLFYSSLYFAKCSCFLAGIGSRCHHKYPKKHWICPRWIHRVKVPPPEPCTWCQYMCDFRAAGEVRWVFVMCCFLQPFLPNFGDRMPAPYSAEDVANCFAQFPKLKQVSWQNR